MNDDVTLAFAAETQNVSLARTVSAAMSARADLPLDQLEDVRLAVDEAVSQLIVDAAPGARITCVFEVADGRLDITVSGTTATGTTPSRDTFSWMVLSALVDDVTATVADTTVTLTMRVTRSASVGA